MGGKHDCKDKVLNSEFCNIDFLVLQQIYLSISFIKYISAALYKKYFVHRSNH